jgi:hydroxyacylglutathione hydrolase
LTHGQLLSLGGYQFEVRHTPGHTAGHVVFYCAEEKVLFCGDVIFEGSIGRTDLLGGDYNTLMNSIHTQILTLPDETRLLSGHGGETTVGIERRFNPFLI